MSGRRFRLIDTAGSELGIIESDQPLGEGDTVAFEGTEREIVEVYDDEDGQEGGVAATLVLDD